MSIIDAIPSSRLICGDDTHAFRDPAVIYRDGVFHLYCTYVETEDTGDIYMYTIHTRSTDLIRWSAPEKLTPRDKALNFSSPGNIVAKDGKFLLCLQTYPRENGEKYGNQNARVFTMASSDLETWDAPRMIPVKGDIPVSEMGRMIDPYLIYDPNTRLWNCFFKQNGVSRSVSEDLTRWEFCGRMDGGENVSVLPKDGGYYLFHSPENGIGVKYSEDLTHWQDVGGLLTFGQEDWPWARGRLTAGFVLPFKESGETLYLMFFHGTGPEGEDVTFDANASIGLAWSRDLVTWEWR
jgi:hypothetical protein